MSRILSTKASAAPAGRCLAAAGLPAQTTFDDDPDRPAADRTGVVIRNALHHGVGGHTSVTAPSNLGDTRSLACGVDREAAGGFRRVPADR